MLVLLGLPFGRNFKKYSITSGKYQVVNPTMYLSIIKSVKVCTWGSFQGFEACLEISFLLLVKIELGNYKYQVNLDNKRVI